MNRRLLTILLIALVVASGCTWLVYHLIVGRLTAARPVATTQVVTAAKDIPIGAVLTAADLNWMTITGAAPKGAFLRQEDVIGRGAISDIYQGEVIFDNRLAGPGSGGGLAPTIPEGMRACAVKVDQVVGLSGFVLPGMRVDVLVSGNPPGTTNSAEGMITQTVLQNIGVLSAGTDMQKDAEGKPQLVQVVNLLVTPEQAETLSLAASSELKIQLALRNPLDTTIAKVAPTALSSLFAGVNGLGRPRLAGRGRRKPVEKVYTVIVGNGSNTTEAKFSSPEGLH